MNENNMQDKGIKAAKIILPFFFIFGIVIFIIGISSLITNVHKKENCTEKVIATCTKIKQIKQSSKQRNEHTTYTPVFTYEYNNKIYESQYGKSYSERKKDTFEKNKKYTIFVNPEYPNQYIVEGHENDIDTFAIVVPLGSAIMIIFLTIAVFVVNRKKEKGRNN